jgi:hypothetical protein
MDIEANKAKRYQESRDIWKDYNDNQKFEHDLINRKTTWSLTIQGLLFAAYGVTFGKMADFQNISGSDSVFEFRRGIAVLGLMVAIATFVGVAAVINSKRRQRLLYRDFYRNSIEYSLPLPHKKLHWGVSTRNTWWTLVPDLILPWLFAGMWVYVLVTLKRPPV